MSQEIASSNDKQGDDAAPKFQFKNQIGKELAPENGNEQENPDQHNEDLTNIPAFLADNSDDYNVYDEDIKNIVTTIFKDQATNQQIRQLSNSLSVILDREVQRLTDHSCNKRINTNYQKPGINIIIPISQQNPYNFLPPAAPPMVQQPIPQPMPNPYQMNPMPMMPNPYQMNGMPMQNPYQMPLMQNPYQVDLASVKKEDKKKKDKKKEKEKEKDKEKDKKKDKKKKGKEIKCDTGVFHYLYDKYKSSPINKGLVEITGSRVGGFGSEASLLKNIIDPSSSNQHWTSPNDENSYVNIEFKNMIVKVKRYHIKCGFKNGEYVFRSWILKGTKEDGTGIVLDEIDETDKISRSTPEGTFDAKSQEYVRSLRLTMRKKNGFNYQMAIRNIELYGDIKILKEPE